VIAATAVQLRVGARLLLGETSPDFEATGSAWDAVGQQDHATKVSPVRRHTLAPYPRRRWLPRRTPAGDLERSPDRILAARGLTPLRELRAAETARHRATAR
jgi:hypothetical protein